MHLLPPIMSESFGSSSSSFWNERVEVWWSKGQNTHSCSKLAPVKWKKKKGKVLHGEYVRTYVCEKREEENSLSQLKMSRRSISNRHSRVWMIAWESWTGFSVGSASSLFVGAYDGFMLWGEKWWLVIKVLLENCESLKQCHNFKAKYGFE